MTFVNEATLSNFGENCLCSKMCPSSFMNSKCSLQYHAHAELYLQLLSTDERCVTKEIESMLMIQSDEPGVSFKLLSVKGCCWVRSSFPLVKNVDAQKLLLRICNNFWFPFHYNFAETRCRLKSTHTRINGNEPVSSCLWIQIILRCV